MWCVSQKMLVYYKLKKVAKYYVLGVVTIYIHQKPWYSTNNGLQAHGFSPKYIHLNCPFRQSIYFELKISLSSIITYAHIQMFKFVTCFINDIIYHIFTEIYIKINICNIKHMYLLNNGTCVYTYRAIIFEKSGKTYLWTVNVLYTCDSPIFGKILFSFFFLCTLVSISMRTKHRF